LPTYEYKCPNCGRFELLQRITEDALTACPTCGAAVKRLMPHKVFIAFKGPGFHVNDYPSTGRPRTAEGEDKPVTADVKADEKPLKPDKSASGPADKAAGGGA